MSLFFVVITEPHESCSKFTYPVLYSAPRASMFFGALVNFYAPVVSVRTILHVPFPAYERVLGNCSQVNNYIVAP